jgi:hypothetical protein
VTLEFWQGVSTPPTGSSPMGGSGRPAGRDAAILLTTRRSPDQMCMHRGTGRRIVNVPRDYVIGSSAFGIVPLLPVELILQQRRRLRHGVRPADCGYYLEPRHLVSWRRRLRRRFRFLGHVRSTGRDLCRFNPVAGAMPRSMSPLIPLKGPRERATVKGPGPREPEKHHARKPTPVATAVFRAARALISYMDKVMGSITLRAPAVRHP